MSEQQKLSIPVIKKDALVNIDISYAECGAIVNSLFSLAKGSAPMDLEEFKKLIEGGLEVKDQIQITYLILDKLYRKILEQAKKNDQIEMTEFTIPNPLEALKGSNPEVTQNDQ